MNANLRYIVLFLVSTLFVSGCNFKIGTAETVIRPATRIPDTIVESGSGEYIHQPGVDSGEDSVFLLFRGSF